MKKISLLLAACSITVFFAFKQSEHDITGRWYSNLSDNAKAYFDFTKEGSFKVTANGQTENEGSYKLNKDTFYMYDKNCGLDVAGKYMLHFYGYDSVSFSMINDPCTDRANEVNGGMIKRLRD